MTISRSFTTAEGKECGAPILDRLRCPRCAEKLPVHTWGSSGPIQCPACHASYPVPDGIPDFVVATSEYQAELAEEEKPYSHADAATDASLEEIEHGSFPSGHIFAHERARSSIAESLQHLGCLDTQDVLSVGAGTGIEIKYLEQFTKRIVGTDYSHKALQWFRLAHDYPVVRADAKRLPFEDESFDYVVVSGLVHHIAGYQDVSPFFMEWQRVLKRGGGLIVVEPNRLYPVSWLMYPVNLVGQKVKPGWRGAVPHERALLPGWLVRAFGEANLEQVEFWAASYAHNRLPLGINKAIESALGAFRKTRPFKALGYWTVFCGRRPASG